TGQTITVGAGTYSVTVTDANGCTSAAAQGTVNSAALPNAADAGNDAMVCMNDFPIALSGSVQNATGGQWSGGTGSFAGQTPSTFYTPSAAEVAAGYVDLVLTTTGNTGCPPASDQVHILISNSFLNAAVSTTPILCNGGSTGTAAFSPAQPVYDYQWSPSGQNGPVATGLSGGTHTVTVTDQLGCDTVMSVSLIDPPTLTVTAAQSTGPLCANGTNGSITLSVTGGTAPYTYQWSTNAGGQTTATANNLGAGAYQVTVTDANGCIAQASATLTAPAPIMLTAQVPDTVCVNTPIQLTAQVSGGTGATTIYWGGIGYGPSMQYSFPTSQIVSVSATDAVGCTSPILTFPVNVLDLNAATLVMSNDTTVCPGGTAQVSAAVNNYPGAINIQWTELVTTGTGPFNVPVSNTQTLHVLVTNTCGQMLNGDVTLTL
ncbi:MAG TPA: SprB repeat-containing protein, partial [Flavobacteriales bacterium]|nr:SprB repeat-containing protein [Flavobacteriales bacterium]